MKVIRFRRLDKNYCEPVVNKRLGIDIWEIAFDVEDLNAKLNGAMAEVIMPAKPWYIRLYRKFFPLKGILQEIEKEN